MERSWIVGSNPLQSRAEKGVAALNAIFFSLTKSLASTKLAAVYGHLAPLYFETVSGNVGNDGGCVYQRLIGISFDAPRLAADVYARWSRESPQEAATWRATLPDSTFKSQLGE
ncbi:MAG: hypothetical protein EXS36_19335 [Pedosphaera sp.]|nr:hypothetical protein [Pedosphaera sp.]